MQLNNIELINNLRINNISVYMEKKIIVLNKI